MGLFKKTAPKPGGKHVSKEHHTQYLIIARQERQERPDEPRPSRHKPDTHASHRSGRIWSDPDWR